LTDPELETGPFFGHGLQAALQLPAAWTYGEKPGAWYVMPDGTAKVIADAVVADAIAAAESAGGQGELPAAETKPEVSDPPPDPPAPEVPPDSVDFFIEFAHPWLSKKEVQVLAYVQTHALQLQHNHTQQWLDKQKPESYVHSIAPKICACVCTCDHRWGSMSHAGDCPLGSPLNCEGVKK
jgi:hypothetical protein